MQKLLIGMIVFLVFIFGLLFWLAWEILLKFEPGQVRFWGALVTAGGPFVIVGAYAVGFYLGKTEARGALSGLDQATERISKVVAQTVNTRDASRIRVQNTIPQAGAPIVLFPANDQPLISHRNTRESGNEIIDLD